MTKSQVELTLLLFVSLFVIKGNAKFQFKISETKDVIFFLDPMNSIHKPFFLVGDGSWISGYDRPCPLVPETDHMDGLLKGNWVSHLYQ